MSKWLLVLLVIIMQVGSAMAVQNDTIVQQELEKAIGEMLHKIPKGTRIGVDNLKNDISTNDVTDFLMTALTRAGYVVLDRRNMDEIFKQIGVELDGLVFDQKALESIEKIKGVDAIIYGTVKDYSTESGKTNLNVHLQCTYIGKGGTHWAHDIVAETSSKGRKMMPFIIAGGVLFIIGLIIIGVKNSGKSRVVNS